MIRLPIPLAAVAIILLSSCDLSTGPSCSNPAPYLNQQFLEYHDKHHVGLLRDLDAEEVTAELAERWDFTPNWVSTSVNFFSAELDQPTVAALRCDERVRLVEVVVVCVTPCIDV